MNENEAIEQFKERLSINDYKEQIPEYYEAMEMAVKALQEIQQYREIGTPDECREAVEQLKAAKEDIRKLLCEEYGSSCQFCIQSDNEDAMCSKVCGSSSWCCENAAWKSHRLE